MALTDSILALKNLARTAQKLALADFDKACDEVAAVANHKGELEAAVEKLKAEVASLTSGITAAKVEKAAHEKAASLAVEAKQKAEATLKDAQAGLALVRAKITALLP
jgi:cell division protein FtsB